MSQKELEYLTEAQEYDAKPLLKGRRGHGEHRGSRHMMPLCGQFPRTASSVTSNISLSTHSGGGSVAVPAHPAHSVGLHIAPSMQVVGGVPHIAHLVQSGSNSLHVHQPASYVLHAPTSAH